MITANQIRKGIDQGVIRFIVDPNMGAGTVCQIGGDGWWFYFGGMTAEEENPEEFLEHSSMDDVVNSIFEALEGFRGCEECANEYGYYECVLKEAGI